MFNKLKKFHNDIGGNFALMFGLALTPLMIATGLAIDYSRMSNLENKMQVSSDAALLAAMKKLDEERTPQTTYEETIAILEGVFEPFFEANLLSNNVTEYESYDIDFVQIDNEAIGTVTVEYDPVIMDAFGHDKFDLTSTLKVNLRVIPENFVFDIVMCIDATGSMQDTIDAAVASAGTFDSELRTELGIPQDSNDAKIRLRPIFYRDTTEQEYWEYASEDAVADAANSSNNSGTLTQEEVEAARQDLLNMYDGSNTFRINNSGQWKSNGSPRNYKKVKFDGNLNGYDADAENDVFYRYKPNNNNPHQFLFNKSAEGREQLEEAVLIWFPDVVEGEGGAISENEYIDKLVHISGEVDGPDDAWDRVGDDTVSEPEGMKSYVDFLDMNPDATDTPNGTTAEVTALKDLNKSRFQSFLGSENAKYGADLPEAAGACMDEAMRSNWWVENSQVSRDFFDIPEGAVINDPDALLSVKVTTVPLIVFWTDAAIQSLSLTQQWIQPTQPTSYSSFEAQWEDENIIPYQDSKILMMFGNDSLSGWSTVKDWGNYVYGGSLDTGNTQAIDKIADEILKMVPEVLRISG